MASREDRKKILIGVTASVAAVKVPELVSKLAQVAQVRVVWTKQARHFLHVSENYNPLAYKEYIRLAETYEIVSYQDEDEWGYQRVGRDPVVHIELRKWADLFLIAPLSANTLGKISNGICDNLLSCVARAWDFSKPFIVAPAMNTFMWDHPVTSQQLQTIAQWGIKSVHPMDKTLACGDQGAGALAAVEAICNTVLHELEISSLNASVPEPELALRIRPMHATDRERIIDLVQQYCPARSVKWVKDEESGNDCLLVVGEHMAKLQDITVVEDTATKVLQAVSSAPCSPTSSIRPFIGDEKFRCMFNEEGFRFMGLQSIRDCFVSTCNK